MKAHRFVLGLASDVFKKMLLVTGTDDMEAKEIPVKETTVAAFKAMVDAIYSTKSMVDAIYSTKSIQEHWS